MPPPEFPPALVPVWGGLHDALQSALATFAAAGSPAGGIVDKNYLADRAMRILRSTPDADQHSSYTDLANGMVAELGDFELRYAAPAATRTGRMTSAREALEEAGPSDLFDDAGDVMSSVTSAASLLAVAAIGYVAYKALS